MRKQHPWARSSAVSFEQGKKSPASDFLLLCMAVFLGGFSAVFFWHWPSADASGVESPHGATTLFAAPDTISMNFPICGDGPRSTCVVDGDTIWLSGTKIRIADINTPEISSPECKYEADLGQQATLRLQMLLNQGAFSLKTIERDEDRYGRKLRVITRGGASLGDVLVEEGLAERWSGSRRNWC